jgi:predicted nucleotidyltransferase
VVTAGISDAVDQLARTLGDRLVAVVLFGSRARGDSEENSDWDLLVIADDLPVRPLERLRRLKESLPPFWRGRVSFLVKTSTEFEASVSSLYLDIALDGRVLYDPRGYARHKLDALRRLLANKGLRRVRRGRDWVWEWEEFPGLDWSLTWQEAG